MNVDQRHHAGLGVLEDVAMHHPASLIERHQADLDRLLRVHEHRVSEERLIHRLLTAPKQLEEHPVEMHRVKAKRFVHESNLAKPIEWQLCVRRAVAVRGRLMASGEIAVAGGATIKSL